MNTKDRLELARWVVSAAKAEGANEVAVNISNSRSVDVEFREGQLEKLKESTQNSLNINVYADNKYSGHSTNDLRRDSLGKFVRDAVALTKYLSEDQYRKLPDPKFYAGLKQMDLELIDDSYDDITSEKRVMIAKELQTLTAGKSDKIISSTSGYYDSDDESIKVHSNGFEGVQRETAFSTGVEVTVEDANGGRPSDWNYATTHYLSDMPTPEELASVAVERTLAKVGQTKIESGVYDMLVTNRAASNMVYAMYGPMGGRALQQKSSFLEDMKGKKIASDKLTLIDDPFIKRGLGSKLYNGEGMVTRKRTLIDKGVLQEYLIDCYYARKLGVEPTGSSTSNIVFEYGDKSLDELIKGISKGILVNGFLGGNSNSTTGDYSWGLQGMLIEYGKLVKPINEMNISGNLLDLWANLVEVGNDPYKYSSLLRPSMLFKEINFSGI